DLRDRGEYGVGALGCRRPAFVPQRAYTGCCVRHVAWSGEFEAPGLDRGAADVDADHPHRHHIRPCAVGVLPCTADIRPGTATLPGRSRSPATCFARSRVAGAAAITARAPCRE